MYTWLFYVSIALDQLVNAVFGGYPDETISARCYREKRWQQRWIDRLFFWQRENGKGHCEQCFNYELARKDLPKEYREVRDEGRETREEKEHSPLVPHP